MEFLDTIDSRPVLLSEVDFDWVERCDNVSHLRSAITQLENEHYPELLQACRERLDEIEPSHQTSMKQQEQQQRDVITAQINESLLECQSRENELQHQLRNITINDVSHLPPVRSTAQTNEHTTISSSSSKTLTRAEHALLYQRAKAQGNESYRAVELEAALTYYRRAAEHRDCADLKDSTIDTNLAITCIKLKLYEQAIQHSDNALRDDDTNYKALWRRAQALEGMCLYERSLIDYRAAAIGCSDPSRLRDIAKDQARCEKRWLECDGGRMNTKQANVSRRMHIVDEDESDHEDDEKIESDEMKQQLAPAQTTYRSKSGFLVEVLDD